MQFNETKNRSIIKSLTFRIIIVLADLVVIYAVTRHVGVAITLTVVTNISSTVLYYVHERSWNSIRWGKRRIK